MSATLDQTHCRVLLVSPEGNLHRTLERILCRCGYRVAVVDRGEAALEQAAHGDFDVIVSEVDLPGPVCGVTLLRRLRERGIDIPVVMLTERDTRRLREILGDTRAATCLSTDEDPGRLKSALADFLSHQVPRASERRL